MTQGSNNGAVRADIVPGVPQKNSLWDPSCSYGTACAPYATPAAFQRPPLGQLGNAPATLPQLYTLLQKNLDMSVVKNIYFGESRRRYIQIKADAMNVLNTRGYAMSSGNSFNGAWIQKAPSFTGDISAANFTAWANAWTASHPGDPVSNVAKTATNPVYAQVVNLTAVPRAANGGVLPNNFSLCHCRRTLVFCLRTTLTPNAARAKKLQPLDRWIQHELGHAELLQQRAIHAVRAESGFLMFRVKKLCVAGNSAVPERPATRSSSAMNRSDWKV